ncbi:MAG TPA: hypothetical protein VGQ39_22325 [Pyrinomonadaceae bacterium]|jgi:hypothetical protein|nr:hypothetical protein [Pyrinomonadaceae bacterium]
MSRPAILRNFESDNFAALAVTFQNSVVTPERATIGWGINFSVNQPGWPHPTKLLLRNLSRVVLPHFAEHRRDYLRIHTTIEATGLLGRQNKRQASVPSSCKE